MGRVKNDILMNEMNDQMNEMNGEFEILFIPQRKPKANNPKPKRISKEEEKHLFGLNLKPETN